MNIERQMMINAVLEGKLDSSFVTEDDLIQYQFLLDAKQFAYSFVEALECNPACTFSEVKFGMMN